MFQWLHAVQCIISIGLLSCLKASLPIADTRIHNSIHDQQHIPFTLIKYDNLIALYPFDGHDFTNAVPFNGNGINARYSTLAFSS